MDSIDIPATYDKLDSVLVFESHFVPPAEPLYQFHHILEVDDGRTMDPEENGAKPRGARKVLPAQHLPFLWGLLV